MKLSVFSGILVFLIVKDLTIQADVSFKCPNGYTEPKNSGSSSCYKVYPDMMTKFDALDRCKLDHGKLASIPNAFVNAYIYYLASKLDIPSLWIGVNCYNGENNCSNDDGSELAYSNFKAGEPDSFEACVYMLTTGRNTQKWATFACMQTFPFACEVAV